MEWLFNLEGEFQQSGTSQTDIVLPTIDIFKKSFKKHGYLTIASLFILDSALLINCLLLFQKNEGMHNYGTRHALCAIIVSRFARSSNY